MNLFVHDLLLTRLIFLLVNIVRTGIYHSILAWAWSAWSWGGLVWAWAGLGWDGLLMRLDLRCRYQVPSDTADID
jgi:hypothetical protein